jgi:multimeric flavodoxin WrbA
MKIVAILGSPHGLKGTTGWLMGEVVRGAEAAGADVTSLLLSERKVGPCLACDTCHKTGQCARRDDFPKFKAALEAADGVVLASPNYIVSVTAQTKALMDRCCGLLHLQALEGKYGAAVVTSGGPGSPEVEHYMLRFLRALGLWTVGSVGAEAAQLFQEPSKARCAAEAADLGRRLVESIRQTRTFPEQDAERAAFAERMKQLVTFRKDAWPFEYEAWKSTGRL